MAYGVMGYSQPSDSTQPSGAIWGDCESFQMLDEGTGSFEYRDFVATQTAPGLPNSTPAGGAFSFNTTLDHAIDMSTGSLSTGNQIALFTRPTVAIAPGSGQPLWFEVRVASGDVTKNRGIFIGFAGSTGLTSTLQTDASTLNGSTSLVGFWLHGNVLNKVDAIYQKGTAAAPQTTPSTVLADVTNASANNPNPGNPFFVPPTAPGNLTNNTMFKFGLRYDGKKYMYWYVNGSQVAKALVDATGFNITSTMGTIVSLFAPDATVLAETVAFYRAGALAFP